MVLIIFTPPITEPTPKKKAENKAKNIKFSAPISFLKKDLVSIPLSTPKQLVSYFWIIFKLKFFFKQGIN